MNAHTKEQLCGLHSPTSPKPMKAGKLFSMAAFSAALLLSAPAAFAQTGQVTGTVTDSLSGEALPGINVVVAGTQQGAATGAQGTYTISDLEPGTYELRATSITYATKTAEVDVRAGETTTADFALAQDVSELNELVVVGYGTQRREDVTSAVSSVRSDEFVEGATKDAASLIAGKVAGLNVVQSSGDPTAGSQISLRGTTTLTASSSPLVLINGVPGSLGTVAPENIESVDVLKDGSAAAIYGSRGSNGVILITTKESDGGPTRIRYNGYMSYDQITNRPDFLDADDYQRLAEEETSHDFQDLGYETNWQDQILRNPVSQTHNFTFLGGSSETNYTASLNYENTQGIFRNSDNQKATAQVRIGHSMYDGKLRADLNLLGSYQTYWTGADGGSFNTYVWRQSLIRNPTDRVFDDEENYVERSSIYYDNPVALLQEAGGENEDRNLRLNGTLSFNPIESLTLKLLGAVERWTQMRGYSESFRHVSTVNSGLDGYASRGLSSNQDQLLELTGTYADNVGSHEFSLLGGYSYQNVVSEGFFANTYGFPTDVFDYNSLESGDALQEGQANINSDKSSYKLIGFFSRLNYSWKDRYILMASARYEGNSKFGADNKWGIFPAVSAGWRISEEGFMEDVSFIDELKLRGGFGVTGIAPSAAYQSLTSYGYGDRFFFRGEWVQGVAPVRNPNPNLRWERKEEINVGLDFALLGSRLSGSLDVYRRNTKDMLWNYSVPVPPNLYGSILANVGQMRNEGVEAVLEYAVLQREDLQWTTSANYSTNRNELVSLSNELYETADDYFYTGWTGEPIQLPTHRVEIGEPVGSFYGFESVDIDENGRWIVLDQEGERISIDEATPDDRRYIGNAIPDHTIAWNNNFRYRGFDLSLAVAGAFGHQILNGQRMFFENPTGTRYNMLESAFDDVYGKRTLDYELAYVSYYVEDGDYLKINSATLGYSFSGQSLGLQPLAEVVSNARVYVSGRNLYTFTGYQGIDPEVNTGGLEPGHDSRDKYPTTRTFTLGVNLTF